MWLTQFAEIYKPLRETPLRLWPVRPFQRLNWRVQTGLRSVIDRIYQPMLEKALDNRGITFSVFAAILILTVGVMNSGMVRTVLFPDYFFSFARSA